MQRIATGVYRGFRGAHEWLHHLRPPGNAAARGGARREVVRGGLRIDEGPLSFFNIVRHTKLVPIGGVLNVNESGRGRIRARPRLSPAVSCERCHAASSTASCRIQQSGHCPPHTCRTNITSNGVSLVKYIYYSKMLLSNILI